MKRTLVFILLSIFCCTCSCTSETDNIDTQISLSTPETTVTIEEPSEESEPLDNFNTYNTLSSTDGNFIYLGGQGNIIKFDPVSSSAIVLYSSPHLLGAASYKNYVYFIQHNVTDDGTYAYLMRTDKDGTITETLAEADTSYYDLQIYDSILSLRKYEHFEYSFDYYELDEKGDILKELDETDLINVADPTHICTDPLYTLHAYDAIYEFEPIAESGKVSFTKTCSGGTHISNTIYSDTFSGSLILVKDENTILYKNHLDQICCLSLMTGEEIIIYDNPSSFTIKVLNYEDNWIYFSQKNSENTGEDLYRVNLETSDQEKIYTLENGSIYRLSIYEQYVFFYCNDNNNFYWMYDILS